MMILAYPWPLVATVFFGLLCFAAESAQQKRLAAASRILASLGFVLGAVGSPLVDSNYGHRLLAGTLLSWTGDLLLLGRGRFTILFALITAIVSHVCYMQAMLLWGFGPINLGCLFLGLLAPASIIKAWIWPKTPKTLQAPTLIYIVTSALFLACTLAASPNHPRPLIASIGAVALVLSNLITLKDRFIERTLKNNRVGSALYWLGQWLIVSTAGLG